MADQGKHTKGEWVREGRTVYALEVDKDRRGREYLRNRFTAGFSGGPGTPESEVEANAQLATAAPDLLDALRNARASLANYGSATDPVHVAQMVEIDAAIARATHPTPETP